jgi:hypothetical protein
MPAVNSRNGLSDKPFLSRSFDLLPGQRSYIYIYIFIYTIIYMDVSYYSLSVGGD